MWGLSLDGALLAAALTAVPLALGLLQVRGFHGAYAMLFHGDSPWGEIEMAQGHFGLEPLLLPQGGGACRSLILPQL